MFVTRFFPEGTHLLACTRRARRVLQQDGDPCHVVASDEFGKSQEGAFHAAIVLEDWPPESPELNPVENVWALVDGVVKAQGCKTIQEFDKAIQNSFAALRPEACARNITDMPRRMKEVVARGGARIDC